MTKMVPNLDAAIAEIRTLGAVAVIGAGASFMAGMPLAGQLAPLVWHTLDAHPTVRRAVCSELGHQDGIAKNFLGDNCERIRVAFKHIAADRSARRLFQHSFAILDRERATQFSSVHAALARLVHGAQIQLVVSLNWDTLLEVAYLRRYGVEINAHFIRLWKPHGDANRPNDAWVLPHEPGQVSDELVQRVSALAAERPRNLLIIGYSEADEVVVQRFIKPLANRWRVFRISPNADGEGAIPVEAHVALELMADSLCPDPEVIGWDYETFANQRGIAAAVSGERLGPRDVEACPKLPHFEVAKRHLDLVHSVEIAGEAGSGKSITAWQLAHSYQTDGWEVLKPDPTWTGPVDQWPESPTRAPGKKVLVIDDTQTFPPRFVHRIAAIASSDTKVILATTDPEGQRTRSVQIPARAAVDRLASEFRQRRKEVLEIVRRYDPQIGDSYLDIPLERRIEEAAKTDTAWQFAFVLRGGWRQARERLNVFRNYDRADILLVVVAARQLLSLDAGSCKQAVLEDAQRLGRSKQWAEKNIERLRSHSAILSAEQLRCPHIRFAGIVIESFFKDRLDPEFTRVVSVLRSMVFDQHPPLRGISWFLPKLLLADAFRLYDDGTSVFMQPGQRDQLIRRCLNAIDPLECRDAASLLATFVGWRDLGWKELAAHREILKRWAKNQLMSRFLSNHSICAP